MSKLKACFFILSFTFSIFISLSYGQAPGIQWAKCYGGNISESARFILPLQNGNFLVAGEGSSAVGDIIGVHNPPFLDYWLIEIDSLGAIQWQKCYGGSNLESLSSIQPTMDGGYILAGATNSNDGDVSGNHDTITGTYIDCWLLKLDASRNIQWQKCYGGSISDKAMEARQTADGGYIFTAGVHSNDGDVSGNHLTGTFDCWVVKTDSVGTIEWQECLGGDDFDIGSSIFQLGDGNYILVGTTSSINGDVTGNHGGQDIWVVKLDTSGTILWQKCLGGSNNEIGEFIRETSDGYFLAGNSQSNDGDVAGNHDSTGANYDLWIANLDDSANVIMQKCFGGSGYEFFDKPLFCPDSGYAFAGFTLSHDGDITSNLDTMYPNYCVVKTDNAFNIEWQKCMGGSSRDFGHAVEVTPDGGFLVVGESESNDGDVSGNHDSLQSYRDFWIVKLGGFFSAAQEFRKWNTSFSCDLTIDNLIINIECKESLILQLNLYDMIGRKIISREIRTKKGTTIATISTGYLARGMYVAELINDNSSMTSKVFKE